MTEQPSELASNGLALRFSGLFDAIEVDLKKGGLLPKGEARVRTDEELGKMCDLFLAGVKGAHGIEHDRYDELVDPEVEAILAQIKALVTNSRVFLGKIKS